MDNWGKTHGSWTRCRGYSSAQGPARLVLRGEALYRLSRVQRYNIQIAVFEFFGKKMQGGMHFFLWSMPLVPATASEGGFLTHDSNVVLSRGRSFHTPKSVTRHSVTATFQPIPLISICKQKIFYYILYIYNI